MTQLPITNSQIVHPNQTPTLATRSTALMQQFLQIQHLYKLAAFDPHYRPLLKKELDCYQINYQLNPEPFLLNTPPLGMFSRVPENHVPIGQLLNGETLSIPIGFGGTSSHILVCGASGYGKTTFLLRTLQHITRTQRAIVIAFDRKGDLRRLAQDDPSGQTVVLGEKDLKIAMFQRI